MTWGRGSNCRDRKLKTSEAIPHRRSASHLTSKKTSTGQLTSKETGRPPRRDCIDVEGWMAGGRRKQLAYVMSKQHIRMMTRFSIRQLVVVFAAACRTSATEREQGKKFTEEARLGNLRLSGHAPSTTKRGAQNMADSRNRRQELVEPEACATQKRGERN